MTFTSRFDAMGRRMAEWMKTQVIGGVTYYDRWIKPIEGLKAGTVYAGRPPGNGPELMPWGASLNRDADCAVGPNVAFCSMMESTDTGYDKRFTRYTPKTQGSSLLSSHSAPRAWAERRHAHQLSHLPGCKKDFGRSLRHSGRAGNLCSWARHACRPPCSRWCRHCAARRQAGEEGSGGRY